MSKIQSPALPAGALILVTGANGFIGSHVVDQFLLAGYQVRGTVRNAKKCSWLQELFDTRYEKGRFEMIEVSEFGKEGALDKALEGTAGVAHTASDLSFGSDPNVVITPVVELCVTILKAASKVPTIKRFVYTSSSTAVTLPIPNKKFTINVDTWNEDCVKQAWAPPPYEQSRGYAVYGASKMQAEQALWKFEKEYHPGFVLNTVLPDTTFGASIDLKHQGHPSTSGFVASLAKGGREEFEFLMNLLPPQYFVDVQDAARLHVIGMLHPGVKSERIFGFAEAFNWNDILAILRKNYPTHTFQKDEPDMPRDLSTVVPRERTIELLKEFGQPGLVSLEQSILDNVKDLFE